MDAILNSYVEVCVVLQCHLSIALASSAWRRRCAQPSKHRAPYASKCLGILGTSSNLSESFVASVAPDRRRRADMFEDREMLDVHDICMQTTWHTSNRVVGRRRSGATDATNDSLKLELVPRMPRHFEA